MRVRVSVSARVSVRACVSDALASGGYDFSFFFEIVL